ncbi:hypothetical protein GCM10010512_20760 [Streptomyces thermoviolaceus subsp. thermoviolaceus]|nr:hypothetical protein GCM10010512_20760 [Streptomyces thermoviolaceus subsp. thermoviolaceus]
MPVIVRFMLRHAEERGRRAGAGRGRARDAGDSEKRARPSPDDGRGQGRDGAQARRAAAWRGRRYALTALVACALAVLLAVVSADRVGDRDGTVPRRAAGPLARGDDKKPSTAPSSSGAVGAGPRLGLGLATAARCGPEVSSPGGPTARTCVMAQGRDIWARTSYRTTSGERLVATLTLTGPGGRTVRTRCTLDGGDEQGTCETPREHTGDAAAYTAVAELTRAGDAGPLLRSMVNSPSEHGG